MTLGWGLVQVQVGQPSALLLVSLIGAGVGLIVNTLTILVMGIRGGHAFGELRSTVKALGEKMESSVGLLTTEIKALREWRHDLGNIDQRVTGLEIETRDTDERLRRVEQLAEVLKSDYDVRREKARG